MPDAIRQDFPDLEKVAAVAKTGYQITVPGQENESPEKFDERGNMFYVQPQFYEIFDFPWVTGKPETLKEPNTVALTQSMAEKFFGDWHSAIGKTIIMNNKTYLKVTGIIKDLPKNTDLPIYIAISYATFFPRVIKNRDYESRWGSVSSSWHTYVLLKQHTSINQAGTRLSALVKKYIKDNSIATGFTSFYFQPLSDIHFSQKYGAYGHQADKTELIAFGLVGLFILLIACINFINMATAQAVNRSKEVGIRKVLGSRRMGLMLQFIGETMLVTLFAMLLACIIAELTLPWVQKLVDQPVTFNILQYPDILLFMALIVILTGFLAGFYPALIMSGFDPAIALKNKISKNSGGAAVRQSLVVVQFTVTLILITGTLIIMKQMNFFRSKPMGFDKSAIALVDLPGDGISIAKYNTFKNKLSQIPGIKGISFCHTPPSSENYSSNNLKRFNGHNLPSALQINIKLADTGYFSTFGLHFLAGRSFAPSDTVKDYVINETLLKKLGVVDPRDAIGKYLTDNGKKGVITGVVQDFVNRSLTDQIDPLLITTRKTDYEQVALKLRPGDIQQTMQAVKDQYNKIFPKYLYSTSFYDNDIAAYYISEARLAKLFKIFAIIVLLISSIGLLCLLSFITAQRTKEIAVRKILGASGKDILQLIGKSFIIMVLIANMLAFPVAYLLAQKWLNGFAYRINMPVMPFILAGVLSIILTVVIVSLQVIRAAKANPVNALKYE